MILDCFRPNVTYLHYNKANISTYSVIYIFKSVWENAKNKPNSKFRIWPWPLTMTLFSIFWAKDLKLKDSRSLSLMVYKIIIHITYIKCIRGNNSHMERSYRFYQDGTNHAKDVKSNFIKYICRFLLRLRRICEHKENSVRGDDSYTENYLVTQGKLQRRINCSISYTKYLSDILRNKYLSQEQN